MRVRRGILAGLVAGAIVSMPLEAAADGGAYIDFRGGTGSGAGGTHFLPGDSADGTAFVSVPKRFQDLLDRGPFYVYLVGGRGWIEPGRPLPEGTLRLGTATIEHDEGTTFKIRTAFIVPDVVGNYYSVQVCNEPCTIAGFRETLSGSISIVQTEREAQLLNEQQELYGRNWGLKRQLRKATRTLDELGVLPGQADDRMAELTSEIERLENELAASERSRAAGPTQTVVDDRPLANAWALVAIAGALIVALLAIVLAIVFSRRSPRLVIPDTIAELEEVELEHAAR